ncbi:MAG: amidohydrolase family protein [Nakamurella sp.]
MTETWLANVRLVDLDLATQAAAAVRIVDGTIEAIAAAPPAGAVTLDLGGRFLLPGVVTVHTHLSIVFPFNDTDEEEDPALTALRAAERAHAALFAGATTVRCIHEQHRIDITVREAARRGWFRAPRILAGGRALSTPGGHGQGAGSAYAQGPDAFYAAAVAELEAGADHLKIFITGGLAHAGESPDVSEMTDAEIGAVVRAAGEAGTYVVAHAGHHAAIRQALDQGVTSFEHAYAVDEATAALLARPGIYVSPTLSVTRSESWMRANHFEEHSIANARAASGEHLLSIQRLIAAGVTLTNGTDYPPGDDCGGVPAFVAEMGFMHQAGLSVVDTLRSATLNGAALCRIDDHVGRVARGYVADLIAVDDDPLADIAAMGGISFVMQAGIVLRDDRLGTR